MITAVCILAVPVGETRAISDYPVFVCTCLFSVWAYIWMLIVYKVWTPNQVTIVEALLTLLFLPLLVGTSYLISIRAWERKRPSVIEHGEVDAPAEAVRRSTKEEKPLQTGCACVLS